MLIGIAVQPYMGRVGRQNIVITLLIGVFGNSRLLDWTEKSPT